MLKLSQYENKKVRIVTIDKEIYSGVVTLFTPAKDNEVNEDAVVIDNDLWFDAGEIRKIEIIE